MELLPSELVPQVWFITGCSTGLGREMALAVLEGGGRAVVTARNPATIADLAERYPDKALALKLDVTSTADIEAAVLRAVSAFGQIDVLVNNAGYGYMSTVEEGEDSEVRALFETNFFGLVNVTKAVLPLMRQRRRGHIFNVTSVRGLAGSPGSAYYAASKFAVEGLTESLRRETAEFGIKVTAVAPGAFRTDWAGRSLKRASESIGAYSFNAEKHHADIAKKSGHQPGDPARAAQALISVVQSDDPPGHLVLGRPGLNTVRTKIAELSAEVDAWEATTLGADFPS
jgi:NAD(P)-dependent dehydrogenase (short-subunit alcohol dehydrogenase family)